MGRLRQEAVRRATGRPRLSRPLHPSRRDLEFPPRRARREGRHLQMEGLPDQRTRPAQDHDARRPASSSAAFSCTCCRAASTASATTACSPPRFALRTSSAPDTCSPRPRSRPRVRPLARPTATLEPTSSFALLPVLRRPDDRRRDLRRAAPRAVPIAEPHQDRHLMTDATHPASQRRSLSPPAARRNKSAMSARGQPVFPRPMRTLRARASSPSETASRRRFRREHREHRWPPTPRSPAVRDPQIPIVALAKRSPTSPRFPPWEAFERRPQRL